ncbi:MULTISPECIES: winged helix-turn-helix transcriptional regulator [Actinomadura]|uniref:Helix-turn-helix domain-containing protein n=1 Tax=Actinomadura miaoliensis TaxID=430685 RepID=A0ABP7V1M4_9ACTN
MTSTSPDVTGPASGTEADITDELVADVFARACPSRRTLENVTGKWGTLALAALADGSHRFNALRRRVDGVSEKMLSQTLHVLERDGLVVRDVRATIPPHVEYSLTPLGERVAAKLRELIHLVEDEMPAVLAARARYDRARAAD